MIFRPVLAGNIPLRKEELEEDKRTCVKIGPVGVGAKALYLNSFYIRRRYYITWMDVRRVYKRVAMSKGGFSGKGIFSSMAYLVVEKSDGTEQQCNFKFESEVDQVLERIGKEHPSIPLHSAESEKKLNAAKAEQEAKYKKDLPDDAKSTLRKLQRARDFLEKEPRYPKVLVYAAKEKRSVDGTKTSLKILAWTIVAASVAMIVGGIYLRVTKGYDMGLYLALFGGAFIISVYASKVLPTPSRNRRTVQKDWDEAVSMAKGYIETSDFGDGRFPVPPQYAHPVVLDRMIRVVKEGRAETPEEALSVVKEDLKGLNSSVRVSQEEYDEVVTVKPMFLVCGYE